MKPTGGPAFPFPLDKSWQKREDGMTLRDYFAAHCPSVNVQETLTQAMVMIPIPDSRLVQRTAASLIAQFAYDYADAMLKERET